MIFYLKVRNLFKRMGFKAFFVMITKCGYYLTEYPIMQIMEYIPIKVRKKRILLVSNVDVSDNAGAIYDYMLEKKKNLQYDIVWLVDHPERYREQCPENVRFVRQKHRISACRTIKAYYYVRTAEKIMFTHTLNWVKRRSKDQVYINLWHGCGFKANTSADSPIRFDYCLVPGNIFIGTKSEFFQCPENKILPIGYPRYDVMLKKSDMGYKFIQHWKKNGQSKVIIWMPTFRMSSHVKLTDNTLHNMTDIPLLDSEEIIKGLDKFCEEKNVVLLLKQHHLEMKYMLHADLTNIKVIDDDLLQNRNLRLYEILQYTDALLTDYSSVAVDYLLLDKPIGFILQDYEEYKKERGFVFDDPLEYMPGKHIYSLAELQEFIEEVVQGQDIYFQERQKIKEIMHHKNVGSYCEKLLKYFEL